MDILTLVAILSLLTVALVFSPLGLGGGVLYVPILYYILEWEMQEAVIGSLTLVFMVSLGSSLSHSKAGYADKKAANTGRFTAIPSAILGTVVSGILITALGDIIIKILATMVLVFVIERTTTRMRSKDEEAEEEKPLLENKRNYLVGNAFAGASSGMLGIGGGAILVTINRSILKMDARKAAGTSFLVAATIVPVAIISHIILDGVTGNLIERIGIIPIIIIPIFAFISSFLGAKYAIKYLSKDTVTIAFLCAISLSIIRYFIDFITLI